MKKLSYSIKINASPEKVYDIMLGIGSKQTYEEWTTLFSPTSTYEGSWDKGAKIIFTSLDKTGKTSGMIARIAENIPNRFVSIEHQGMLEEDKEITSGPKIESWAGALENYRFEEIETGTLLSIEVDTENEYIKYFEDVWPKALEKLKSGCEEKKVVSN